MTYQESDELMRDATFRGRVRVASLKYATFIMDEDPGVPAHSTRYQWARGTMQNPDMVAMQLQPPVVMEAKVQQDGAAITDPDLQISVEVTINKLL